MTDSILDMFSVLVCRNSRFVRKVVGDAVSDTGLNMSHIVCLRLIELNAGGVSAGVICDTTDHDKALVSRMLGMLSDRGYIMRNPADRSLRRGYRYVLTDKGERFNKRVNAYFAELSEELVKDISADELNQFYRTAAALTDKLQQLAEQKGDRE